MSKDNFKLNYDDNGRVRYVIKAGKDWAFATCTQEQAEWMMKNKPITRSTPTDWPDFCVCADGAYYFEGSWDGEPDTVKDKSIFEPEEAPKDDPQELFTEKQERQSRRNRRRGD